MVLLGLPALTADYDFWIAIDDIATFNRTAATYGLNPTHDTEEARRRGRYVLENDEHVDVLVARSVPITGGEPVEFERLWSRRRSIMVADGVRVNIPSLDDLILAKQMAARARDLEDIRLLQVLRSREAQ